LVASKLLLCGRQQLLDDADASLLTYGIVGGDNPKESQPNLARNWRQPLEASALNLSTPDILQKEGANEQVQCTHFLFIFHPINV
jgi:hypothetical protein